MQILLSLSLIPIIIICMLIYKNDKVEKESSRILTKVFCGGILSVLMTLVISSTLERFIPFFVVENEVNLTLASAIPYYFIGVALIEEFSKWVFVYLFCWKDKEFNYLYDAIVYCVFAALGFAALENILYVLIGGIGTGIIRGIFAVPAHAFFAVFMGYYMGMSKVCYINGDKSKGKKYFNLSIIVPTILHGLYDYLLSIASMWKPGVAFLIFLVFMIWLYIVAIRKVRKVSKINVDIYNKEMKIS